RERRDGQPVLLDLNARLGGASQYQLNKAVWGVDLVEEHLLTCVGIPIRPQVPAEPLRAYATSYLPSPRSGLITSAAFLTPVRDLCSPADLLVCEPWVKPGDEVRGREEGPPDWLGEVTVGADDLPAAKRRRDLLIAHLDYSFIQPPAH